MKYILGIDLGTSSMKGIVIDQGGNLVVQSQKSYETIHTKPGYSEQDPSVWYDAFIKILDDFNEGTQNILPHIEAISFAGQMHSLVMLDENNNLIRPAILWNDTRNTKQSDDIMNQHKEILQKITLNRSLEGFTLPKLLWVKENEPENYAKLKTVLMPKDYLRFQITGLLHAEFSDASGTLLMNLEKNNWSQEICDLFEIDIKVLPELVSSDSIVGTVNKTLKEKYHLNSNIKVIAGGADNACLALGSGLSNQEIGVSSIGTSGVFMSYENTLNNYDGSLHFFSNGIKTHYAMGVTLFAGSALSYIKKLFKNDEPYENFLSEITSNKPGSNGLIFTPYLIGERTPYFDAKIRGSFIGVDVNHTQSNFIQAVMEGIVFSLKDSQTMMTSHTHKNFKSIIALGGGAKNDAWLQMQADIYNTEIITLDKEEGPAMGAAMMAALAMNWFKDIDTMINTFIKIDKKTQPIKENVIKYQELYELYKEVYQSTKNISHKLYNYRY